MVPESARSLEPQNTGAFAIQRVNESGGLVVAVVAMACQERSLCGNFLEYVLRSLKVSFPLFFFVPLYI